MRIDSYEVQGDRVVAVYVSDKRRNMKQFRYEQARPRIDWILCSYRLPEKSGDYLVTTDGTHNDVIDIAEYGLFWHNMKLEMMWNKASKVIAWMPLPEPYKKEGDAE